MIDRTIQQVDISESGFNIVSKHHQLIYDTAIQMIIDKPIIGHGPKMYRELCKDKKYQIDREIRISDTESISNGCSTHPHNTYIQLMVEIGIIGTIPIVCLFFYLIYLAFRQIMSFMNLSEQYFLSDHSVVFTIIMIINLWPIVPSLNFFNNWISILYFLPLGLLLSSEKFFKNQKFLINMIKKIDSLSRVGKSFILVFIDFFISIKSLYLIEYFNSNNYYFSEFFETNFKIIFLLFFFIIIANNISRVTATAIRNLQFNNIFNFLFYSLILSSTVFITSFFGWINFSLFENIYFLLLFFFIRSYIF